MRVLPAGVFFLLLLSPVSARAAQVVVGVAGVDAATTRLLAVDLETSQQQVLGQVTHVAGATPNGSLLSDGRLALVMPDDGRIIFVDTATGQLIDTRALDLARNQRPQQVGAELVAVRQRSGRAEVIALDRAHRVFDVDTPWLSTVAGSTTVFLGSGNGVGERIEWRAGRVERRVLGAGAFRQPTLRADGRLLVEHQAPTATRAQLLQLSPTGGVDDAKVVVEGLAGLSPIANGTRAAAASGRKDGSIVVDSGNGFSHWPGARAGIARPQALTAAGVVVVVALVDRGASLPAELWALTSTGGVLLLAPAAGDVVTVYGIDTSAKQKVKP